MTICIVMWSAAVFWVTCCEKNIYFFLHRTQFNVQTCSILIGFFVILILIAYKIFTCLLSLYWFSLDTKLCRPAGQENHKLCSKQAIITKEKSKITAHACCHSLADRIKLPACSFQISFHTDKHFSPSVQERDNKLRVFDLCLHTLLSISPKKGHKNTNGVGAFPQQNLLRKNVRQYFFSWNILSILSALLHLHF